MKIHPALLLLSALLAADSGRSLRAQAPDEAPPAPAWADTGRASYYADMLHLRPTTSGEPYDRNQMVAAHRTLPFGTLVRVINLRNGRASVVRVIDRGPFRRGRVIDVSRRAAEQLGFLDQGLTHVKLEIVRLGKERAAAGSAADAPGDAGARDPDPSLRDTSSTPARSLPRDTILSKR